MTTIAFIRHGVTDWNEQLRIQGHSDIPLNAEGRRQAAMLAERLSGESWDLIVSSPLSRARETAETIARRMNRQVDAYDLRLREMYCGQIEGTTHEDRLRQWGERWRELELGMEKDEDIAARGLRAVEELTGKYAGSRLLVVSHGGLISHTLRRLLPHDPLQGKLGNTSVTIVSWSDGAWACELYNCTSHLG